jgi:hypothetical protein
MFKIQTIVAGLAVIMTVAVNIGINPWTTILIRSAWAFIIFFILSWGLKKAFGLVAGNDSPQDYSGQNVDIRSYPGEDDLLAKQVSDDFQPWDNEMFANLAEKHSNQ